MIIVLALVLLGIGIYTFANRDAVWDSQVRANEWRGLASERSDGWETMTSIRGGLAIVMGIILLLIGIAQAATYVNPADATATSQAQLYGMMTGMARDFRSTPSETPPAYTATPPATSAQ